MGNRNSPCFRPHPTNADRLNEGSRKLLHSHTTSSYLPSGYIQHSHQCFVEEVGWPMFLPITVAIRNNLEHISNVLDGHSLYHHCVIRIHFSNEMKIRIVVNSGSVEGEFDSGRHHAFGNNWGFIGYYQW